MNSDPTIRAFDRMAQDLAAEMVRRWLRASDTGYTSGFGAAVSCPAWSDTPLDAFASVGDMTHATTSIDRLALSATIHCLTGCAIGEVLGPVIATADTTMQGSRHLP